MLSPLRSKNILYMQNLRSEKMKKSLAIILVGFLFLISNAHAVLNISTDTKDSFGVGEKIYFNYNIQSDVATTIVFVPYISCPNAPLPPIEEKTIYVESGLLYSAIYEDLTVTDDLEPQTCTAYLKILSPVKQTVPKEFKIDTNPSFSFLIKTCKDSSCSNKAKVFVLNENIFIGFDSSVESPEITANLILPDKTSQKIVLPTSIKASQIDTYSIEFEASKEGYKTITGKELFGVIEKEASIPKFSEKPEKTQTENQFQWADYLPIAGIGIAIIIAFGIGLFLIKRKTTSN